MVVVTSLSSSWSISKPDKTGTMHIWLAKGSEKPCTLYPMQYLENHEPPTLETKYPIPLKPRTMYPKLETMQPVPYIPCASIISLTKKWNNPNNL